MPTKPKKPIRCEGWHHVPAFALGGKIGWHQCDNNAVYLVTFKRAGEGEKTLPACKGCYQDLQRGQDCEGAKLITRVQI